MERSCPFVEPLVSTVRDVCWVQLFTECRVQVAQSIDGSAAAALFLDDRPDKPIREREITEWDSSCCLIALRDGRIIKIPDGPLILPSVTIQGMVSLAKERGIPVEERPYATEKRSIG